LLLFSMRTYEFTPRLCDHLICWFELMPQSAVVFGEVSVRVAVPVTMLKLAALVSTPTFPEVSCVINRTRAVAVTGDGLFQVQLLAAAGRSVHSGMGKNVVPPSVLASMSWPAMRTASAASKEIV
jgi:hypothetical protein